jgi:hypothetical protein
MEGTRAYLKPHEVKRLVDEAANTLDVAVDTDTVRWEVQGTGQDSEEAENSGYLMGYRDALMAVQRIVNHGDASPLTHYVEHLRDEIRDWQQEAEDTAPEWTPSFFWNR